MANTPTTPGKRGRKPAVVKTDAQKAKEATEKAAKFKTLANQRCAKIARAMDQLQRLANRRNYVFDATEAKRIQDFIGARVKLVSTAFETALTTGAGTKATNEINLFA